MPAAARTASPARPSTTSFAGVGNDTVLGGDGADVIVGDLGADSLSGGAGDDRVYIDAADVFVNGDAGYDAAYITGGTGLTLDLAASAFEFVQDFAGGADSLNGATSAVAVTVYASGGNDTVTGGSGADTLWGEADNDSIWGGAGSDVLVGGFGMDTLRGGAGGDTLYGTSGGGGDGSRDTFVFDSLVGTDVVFDYVDGTDKLDVSALTSTYASLTITAQGSNAAIYLGGSFIASIAGAAGQLDQGDFILV